MEKLVLERAKLMLREKGYAVIPGVFSKETMDHVRERAYSLIGSPFPDNKNEYLQVRRDPQGNERPALLFWPQSQNGYLAEVAKGPILREIVTYFLGPHVRQLNNQIYFREAGDGDQFAWHQDICFRTPPEDFDGVEERYLQTIIAVDDITEDNGAVEFIPESHLMGDLNLIPRDDSEKGLRVFNRGTWSGEKLTAKSGDVLIWGLLTVHGSEPNVSARDRMTYMNGFCAEAALLNKSRFPVY